MTSRIHFTAFTDSAARADPADGRVTLGPSRTGARPRMGPPHGPQTASAPSWLACFVLGRACDWAALTATSPLVSLGLDVDLQREARVSSSEAEGR